jgi:hypothetical protein
MIGGLRGCDRTRLPARKGVACKVLAPRVARNRFADTIGMRERQHGYIKWTFVSNPPDGPHRTLVTHGSPVLSLTPTKVEVFNQDRSDLYIMSMLVCTWPVRSLSHCQPPQRIEHDYKSLHLRICQTTTSIILSLMFL